MSGDAVGVIGQRAGTEEPKLCAGEDDRARTAGLDDLSGRRQHPGRLVDREWDDPVGVLLLAKALVGIGRRKDFGCRIEAKKPGDFAWVSAQPTGVRVPLR